MDDTFKAKMRQKLSELAYDVCVNKKTEAPYSHPDQGVGEIRAVYHCVCCHQPLFSMEDKFVSGSGWPSFIRAIDEHALRYLEDNSLGVSRIEVCCGSCSAHLGHVFDDGPPRTFKRYCINGVALIKVDCDH